MRRLDKSKDTMTFKPEFTASNIHYEVSAKIGAISWGGIGAIHLLAKRLGLVEAYFMEHSTPDAGSAFCHALRTLSTGGAHVHAVPLPAGFFSCGFRFRFDRAGSVFKAGKNACPTFSRQAGMPAPR